MAKTYTAAALVAMTDTELNDVMAMLVMGWRRGKTRGWCYANSHGNYTGYNTQDWFPASAWRYCGVVIKRMLRRWFTLTMSEGNPHITEASWSEVGSAFGNISVTFWNCHPYRAICCAAVLATQQRKGRQ